MKNAKDRLPRDLYINEPGLKFNTYWLGVGDAGRKSSNVLLHCDGAIHQMTASHLRAVTFLALYCVEDPSCLIPTLY